MHRQIHSARLMEIMTGEAEIDWCSSGEYHFITPRIVVVFADERARAIRDFANTPKMISGVVICSSIAATDTLFAFGKKSLRDRTGAVAFLCDRLARPHECLDTGRTLHRHSQPLNTLVMVPLRRLKTQGVGSRSYDPVLREDAIISHESHLLSFRRRRSTIGDQVAVGRCDSCNARIVPFAICRSNGVRSEE